MDVGSTGFTTCPLIWVQFQDVLLKVGTKAKTLELSIFLNCLGSNITFFWTNTTDAYGHNVNYIGKEDQEALINGKNHTSQDIYYNCILPNSTSSLILPSGNTFKSEPENPNHVVTLNETGLHFFYCGRPYHCYGGGVKATVKVVEHVNECHIHPNCWLNCSFEINALFIRFVIFVEV